MQNELNAGKLLDSNGHLLEAGYSKSLIKQYSRKDIKARAHRIKEWDYYIVTDGKTATAFTVADNSYMSLFSVSFLDFEEKSYITKSVMKWFTFGKLNLPSTSEKGNVMYEDKTIKLSILNDGERRRIECEFKNYGKKGETLTSEIIIEKQPEESMVIATPFDNVKTAFYYNQKINCMMCSGYTKIGSKIYNYDKRESLATLDWGRGVWTYKNTWYWGSMSVYVDGVPCGVNIGYGFGNTEKASENMIFYDGKAHKTDRIVFKIPTKNGKDDFMSEWTFESNDKRINLTFKPLLDRYDNINALIIASNQHQVFGLMNGTIVLDDGKVIEIKDKLGFAEKVMNKW